MYHRFDTAQATDTSSEACESVAYKNVPSNMPDAQDAIGNEGGGSGKTDDFSENSGGGLSDRDVVPGRVKPHVVRRALSDTSREDGRIRGVTGDSASKKRIRENSGIGEQLLDQMPEITDKDVADIEGRPEFEKKF